MTSQTYTLSDNDLIGIDLHQHALRNQGNALLLSRDGKRRNAQFIPKSLLRMPSVLIVARIENETSHKGKFHIVKWKLQQLGWLQSNDDRQGSLLLNLAHGKTASEQGGSSV